MKSKILASVLLLVAFAFAQFGQERPKTDKTDYYYHARTGMYFSTSFTFAYTSLSLHYEKDSWYGEESGDKTFKGWLVPYHEVRLGGYYNEVAAIYGALGIGFGKGDFQRIENLKDGDERGPKLEATSLKFLLGLGADIYPFQDKESALYNLYFGLCGGFAFEGAEITSENTFKQSDANFHNFVARAEIGYDFWFSSRWRFGTSVNYTFGGNINNNERDSRSDYKDREGIANHTIGLTLRIAH